MPIRRVPVAIACAALWVALPAFGQQAPAIDAPGAAAGYFHSWFQRVSRTQAGQPHWITPLATVTPRLEEEFRYDIDWLTAANGSTSENYGGGKGLELIPAERVEILLNLPPYVVHDAAPPPPSFGDF